MAGGAFLGRIASRALRHATVAALSASTARTHTIIIIHLKLLAKGEIPFQTGEFQMMAGNATLLRANWFIQNPFNVLHQLNLVFSILWFCCIPPEQNLQV